MINKMKIKRMNILCEYREGIKILLKEFNNIDCNDINYKLWLCYYLALFNKKLGNNRQAIYYIDEGLKYIESEAVTDEITASLLLYLMIQLKENELDDFQLANSYIEIRNLLKNSIEEMSEEMIGLNLKISLLMNNVNEINKYLNIAIELDYFDLIKLVK